MTNDIEEQLRAAFTHRAEHTTTSGGLDQIGNNGPVPSRSMGGPIAAMATAAVVVVGGILAVNAASTDPVGPADQARTVPQPDEAATADPTSTGDLFSLTLDEWINLPQVDAPDQSWTIVDIGALPSGVELTDQSGSVLLGPPIDSPEPDGDAFDAVAHQYVARLRDNTGTEFTVIVTTLAFGPCSAFDAAAESTQTTADETSAQPGPTEATVDIGGVDAAVQGSLACWPLEPGVNASVEVSGSTLPIDAAASIDLARQLVFTDVARLPQSNNHSDRQPAPDSGDLSGTLNGVPWMATVGSSSLRTMNTYANNQLLGGFQHDRLSQPNDTAAATGELMLTGVPGDGALVYGYLSPEAVAVRAINSSGATIVLPMLQRELESFFVVPIPEGVAVETLEFIRTDGSAFANAEIGRLPYDLGGGYGGFATIKRSPPDPPTVDLNGFCEDYLSRQGEVPERYVGSLQHLADIESLRDVAPESIVNELTTFRDYIASGAIDSVNNPESNLIDNWPADIVAATTAIAEFGDSNC